MPETTTDPLYGQVAELLTTCGATVGLPGSMMHAVAPDPRATLLAIEQRLDSEGLRLREDPVHGESAVRFTVLSTIDRTVTITIDAGAVVPR